MVSFMVANSFSWYVVLFAFFYQTVNDLLANSVITFSQWLAIFSTHYLGTICFAVLGATFFRGKRNLLLALWMLLGSASSMLLILINGTFASSLLASLLLGCTIGFGLPVCFAYFADSTIVENRGVASGITWGFSGFLILVLALGLGNLNTLFEKALALAVWRGLGFVFFSLTRRVEEQEQRIPTLRSILGERTLILYLVSWIMFSLINWIEVPMIAKTLGESLYTYLFIVEYGITALFAIPAGLLCDRIGRKPIVITGFIILGIEYSLLSLFPEMQFTQYLYIAVDGIVWGIFASVFFMIMWGDLAHDRRKERYYLIGELPYLLGSYLSAVLGPTIALIPPIAAFSIASFFLFVAVLPLLYAPETLPEKKLKERELKGYVEKAKKTKGKYT
jgi:MFS family permease